MNPLKNMIDTLQHKPIIGIIGGFSGAFFATVREFLISDSVINGITIAGVWLGFIIAILTGIIKVIELLRIIKKNR